MLLLLKSFYFPARPTPLSKSEFGIAADNKALDGDVILAAQAILIGSDEYPSIVATSNPKHLSLFVNATDWQDI